MKISKETNKIRTRLTDLWGRLERVRTIIENKRYENQPDHGPKQIKRRNQLTRGMDIVHIIIRKDGTERKTNYRIISDVLRPPYSNDYFVYIINTENENNGVKSKPILAFLYNLGLEPNEYGRWQTNLYITASDKTKD